MVVNSLTGLYEACEMAARSTAHKVCLYAKEKDETAVFASWRVERPPVATRSHILDAAIVLTRRLVMTQAQSKL
ncbi:hypothetical protein [Oceanithermus sp.]